MCLYIYIYVGVSVSVSMFCVCVLCLYICLCVRQIGREGKVICLYKLLIYIYTYIPHLYLLYVCR